MKWLLSGWLLCLPAAEALSVLSSSRALLSEPSRRGVHARASAAEDGAVEELEVRLGRKLTPVEVVLAREAVEGALRGLEARLGRSAPRRLEVVDLGEGAEATARQRGLQDASGGAARAAASWGSWRVRAPSDARARVHHVLVQ